MAREKPHAHEWPTPKDATELYECKTCPEKSTGHDLLVMVAAGKAKK